MVRDSWKLQNPTCIYNSLSCHEYEVDVKQQRLRGAQRCLGVVAKVHKRFLSAPFD